MTYEAFRYVFFGGALLGAIMLIVSIALFFLYKIPNVIGDLTGKNAKKAIDAIRSQNESSGNKLYKSSKVNAERGKLTDKISPSGNLIQRDNSVINGGAMNTEKISTQELPYEMTDETTVLSYENETTVLDNTAGETTVLDQAINEQPFVIEYEITLIHTNEIIQMGAIG